MRRRRWLLLIAGVLLCAACMPVSRLPPLPADEVAAELHKQQITQIHDYYAQLHQVFTVAFRLRTANREFCKGWVSAQIGLYAVTPQSLPRKYQSYSAEALNLTWVRPTAISVVQGSPADAAGIKTGDEITALNGELIPVTGTNGWMGGWLKYNGEKPVRVDMRRDGVHQTVTVNPVMACAIPINYVTADEVNAMTDGAKIIVSSSILRVAQTDAQLALVIGHELAHANLGHYEKRQVNALLGLAGGAMIDSGFLVGGISTGGAFSKQFEIAGAKAFSVGFEREADYVGAYYATRAGYDMAGAEEVWRAMGLLNPDSIRFAKTHPSTPMRFVQLRKVTEEIADKKRRNLPLVPELKTIQVEAAPAATRENNY